MSDDTLRSLQEKHTKLIRDAQKLHADRTENSNWSSEDQEQFDRYMSEAKELRDKITAREDRIRDLQESEEFIAHVPVPEMSQHEAEKSFTSIRDPEERAEIMSKAMNKQFRNMAHRAAPHEVPRQQLTALERDALTYEARAAQQSVGTSGAGGVLVPTEWQASVIRQMKAYGGMRRVARILPTSRGGNLNLPVSDDTGNTATIIGEATTGGTTHVPFALVTLEDVKYKSGPIKLSLEVLQDSIIDIDGYVRSAIAERFGRATENHFAARSSTETTGPHGIINYSTGAATAVGTTASPLSVDDLIGLYHSVDPAYRALPSCAWMFSDAFLEELTKTKGTDNHYLWRPDLQRGPGMTLFGKPIVINQDIPNWVAGGTSTYPKAVFFGAWNHYVIRDIMGLQIFPMNERYLNEGNFAVIGFSRHDGRATFASTTPANKPIRCLVQTT